MIRDKYEKERSKRGELFGGNFCTHAADDQWCIGHHSRAKGHAQYKRNSEHGEDILLNG